MDRFYHGIYHRVGYIVVASSAAALTVSVGVADATNSTAGVGVSIFNCSDGYVFNGFCSQYKFYYFHCLLLLLLLKVLIM